MKKSLKNLIVVGAAFVVLSVPSYASAIGQGYHGPTARYASSESTQISKELSELKEVIAQISDYDEQYTMKELEDKNKDFIYEVSFSMGPGFELKLIDQKADKNYKFIDKDIDGILDSYMGSKGFYFKKKDTTPKKWKRLQNDYNRYVKKALTLAKKVLNEKNSSLNEDLKDLE